MSETPQPPAGEPPTWQPAPEPAPQPAPQPTTALPPQAQPVPAATRPPRLLKIWQAALVGAACLIVGLGIGGLFGGLLGYAVADHHHDRTFHVQLPDGAGSHRFGEGRGNGGNGFGQGRPGMGQDLPQQPPGNQQAPDNQTPESTSPSTGQ